MARIIDTADLLEAVNMWLRLDWETGKLYWKMSPRRGVSRGSEAGTVDERGYVRISIPGFPRYWRHQIIWLIMHQRLPLTGFDVDHINQIKGDDRPANLREATRSDNMLNISRTQ